MIDFGLLDSVFGDGTKAARIGDETTADALRRLLAAEEPRVIRLLVETWNAYKFDLTYGDIEAALASGEFDPTYLQGFAESYATMINDALNPRWMAAGTVGAQRTATALEAAGFGVRLDSWRERFGRYMDERAGELARNFADNQREALRNLLRHYTVEDPRPIAEAARMIRPLVGLTDREALAVARLYSELREDGIGEEEARRLAARKASRLHRARAERIARTEVATAFNRGQFDIIDEAIADNDIDREGVVKEWFTASDERVCEICRPLHETKVKFDSDFEDEGRGLASKTPPIHPSCRCTLIYAFP